jgi:hypothetical protein
LRDTAATNGYPGPTSANSRDDFSVGPLEITDGDSVVIAYGGNNISDDPDIVHQQKFNEAETKAVSAIYVFILGGAVGELISTLGLAGALEFVKGILPGDVDKFLSNPVGYLLGIHPTGPCNGFVYRDALTFTGRELAQLPYEPLSVDPHRGSMAKATVKQSYTDDQFGHDTDACGDVAHTDLTIEITRYEKFPLDYPFGPLREGRPVRITSRRGMRENTGIGRGSGSVKQLYGLRN